MKKRVFQIDQECFIIFAEDMSSPKERFLRIGNSDFLKDFGESLTFITLVTPLFPGNPFKEIEIFRPDVDKKIIGLKNVVDRFIQFLEGGGVNTKKVTVIPAEGQGRIDGQKATEDQFIDKVKTDKKIIKHSFASFYNDGNIRVFNKDELMFDLLSRLSETFDERKEIEQLSEYFLNNYKPSYLKNGIIHSNKSLFVFSNNNFACLSDSKDWVRDAIRVGINPAKIDFLFLTDEAAPDSLWIKAFLKKMNVESKIRLLLKEKNPNWLNLISDEVFVPLYPEKESIEINIGEIKLFFQNNRIYIYDKGIKLRFEGENGFLDKGKNIYGEYVISGIKNKFNLIIDSICKDSYTLYSYNPMIFQANINDNDYINRFWATLKNDIPPKIKNYIYKEDDQYLPDFIAPFFDDDSFFSILFSENIRRLNIDGNKDASIEQFNKYKTKLDNLTGEYLNYNQLIVEQFLGVLKQNNRIGVRNLLSNKNFLTIPDQLNPFTFFQKEIDYEDWTFKNNEFKKLTQKSFDKNDKQINLIEKRFKEIAEVKEFFIEERKQLRDFIEILETEERLLLQKEKEIIDKVFNENNKKIVEKPSLKQNEQIIKEDTYNSQEILMNQKFTDFDDYEKKIKNKNHINIKFNKNILIIILLFTLLLIVGVLLFKFAPTIINRFRKTPQKEFLEKLNNKYKPNDKIVSTTIFESISTTISVIQNNETDDKKIIISNENNFEIDYSKTFKTSFYYKFYMTRIDNYHLTNLIATKNGYHRIAFENEKKHLSGMDPDWIYPGNVLVMPDQTKVKIIKGDNMWKICEAYLLSHINKYEIEVRTIIEDTKKNKTSIEAAKKRFSQIKNETHSEMVREFMNALLSQNNYYGWEPYIDIKDIK